MAYQLTIDNDIYTNIENIDNLNINTKLNEKNDIIIHDIIDNTTLLHRLVEEGNINEIDRILENEYQQSFDGEINLMKNGMNLLHRACHNGLKDISLLLINKYNMNINSTTSKGNTPLHACLHNTYIWPHIELAVILISEYGADITRTNHKNETPLESAHKLVDINGNLKNNKYLFIHYF